MPQIDFTGIDPARKRIDFTGIQKQPVKRIDLTGITPKKLEREPLPASAEPLLPEVPPADAVKKREVEDTGEGYPAIIGKQLISGAVTAIPKVAVSAGKIAERFDKAHTGLFKKFMGIPEEFGVREPREDTVEKYTERGIAKVEKYFEPDIPKGDKYKNIASGISKGIGELGALYATGGTSAIIGVSGVKKTEEALALGASLPKALASGTADSLMTALALYVPAKLVAHPALTTFAQRVTAGLATNIPAQVTKEALEMAVLDKHLLGQKHTPEEYENRLYGALVTGGVITLAQAISLSASSKARGKVGPRVERDVTPPTAPSGALAPRQLAPAIAPVGAPVTPPVIPITPPRIVQPGQAAVTPPVAEVAQPVKVRKGQSALKLSPSRIESLKEIRAEVEAGQAGKRVFAEDKITGEVSTFPEYFKDKGLKKKEVLGWIDRTLEGEGTTERMQAVVNDLIEGKRAPIARDIIETRGKPVTVDAIDLNVDDTYKIQGEQFKVKEVLDNGNIVVQDGVRKVLDPDDTVQIDRGTLQREEGAVSIEGRGEFTQPKEPEEFVGSELADATSSYAPKRENVKPLIEMPELVELSKRINEGKSPKIKEKLKNAYGRLRIKAQSKEVADIVRGEADISLRADIFAGNLIREAPVKPKDVMGELVMFKRSVVEESGMQEQDIIFRTDYDKNTRKVFLRAYDGDKQLAPNVMAHEIGHLVDWLDEGDIKRGNILGRIASLKKFLKHHIESTPLDLDKELILSGTMISRKEIMAELKTLSKTWKPFDDSVDSKYRRYRYSSRELYADAISVLANDSQLLRDKAPKFHDSFMAYMDRKPNVKRVYDEIVERGTGERDAVVDTRVDNIYSMFDRGNKARQTLNKKNEGRIEKISDTFMRGLVDKHWDALKPINAQKKILGEIGMQAQIAESNIEEIALIPSEVKNYLEEVMGNARRLNISPEDIGAYAFAKRIATERGELGIANPLGITKKDAIEILEHFPRRWGADKTKTVEDILSNFRETRDKLIIPRIEQSRMFSPDIMEKIKNNKEYIKFNVYDWFENKHGSGVTSQIFRQKGTLAEVENPFVATILQDTSLLRAVTINDAKKNLVPVLESAPGMITKADKKYSADAGKQIAVEPKDPSLGMITFMLDGKPQSFYVSKRIADTFKYAPREATWIAKAWSYMARPLKELFVSKNPVWWARNIQKDFRGTIKNVPDIKLKDVLKLAGKYPEAVKETWRFATGKPPSKDIQSMLRAKILPVGRIYQAEDVTFDNEIDRLTAEYNLSDAENSKEARGKLSRAWDFLDKAGQISESGKLAGFKLLQDMSKYKELLSKDKSALTLEETAQLKKLEHTVRTKVSTPAFTRQGTWHKLTNNIFIFSNMGKEGVRSGVEAYKDDPAGYIWKTVATNVLPKLILAGAGAVGGAYLKKMIAAIPDDDKKNKTVIPLFMTGQGKPVYFAFPEDYEGQTLGALAWDLAHGDILGKEGVVKTLGEAQPYHLNPFMELGADMWQYYANDINPKDWLGRDVIPSAAFRAGGKEANKAMMKHTFNSLGGGLFYKVPTNVLVKDTGEIEKTLRTFPFTILKSFIKVSDRGISQNLSEVLRESRQKGAEISLEKQLIIKRGINEGKYDDEITQDLTDANIPLGPQVSSQIKRQRGFKSSNRYVNALSLARSRKERELIKAQIKKELTAQEYEVIIRLWEDTIMDVR